MLVKPAAPPRALSPRCCFAVGALFAVLSAAGIVAATVVYGVIDASLQQRLHDHYVLDSASAGSYAEWLDQDAPGAPVIYADFYVYHINNPWDMAYHSAKPNLTQFGPLSYFYKQKKYDVTWDAEESGDIVTFWQQQYYVPANDATVALSSKNVTSIYVPLVGVLNNALGADFLAVFFMAETKDPMNLFTNRSMHDVVFGWADDPLQSILRGLLPDMPSRYPGLQGNDSSAAEALRRHGRNRMYTGALTQNLARELLTWDGMDEMYCCTFGPCGDSDSGNASVAVAPWGSDAAEQIQGTTGEQFHQGIASDDVLRVSSHGHGVYRWWPLVETGSYDVKGVTVGRRQLPPDILGNASVSPGESEAYGILGASGLLNLSACDWGAPVAMSKPMFLGASNALRDGIVGLATPDAGLHDTWLGVEPISGQTLDYHFRLAANIYVAPVPVPIVNFTYFDRVAPVMLPLLWVDRHATASDDQIANFKSRVYNSRNLMLASRWGGVAVAIAGGLASVALIAVAVRRRRVLEQGRELSSAAYYSSFYRPLLSPEALLTMAPPVDGDIDGPGGWAADVAS